MKNGSGSSKVSIFDKLTDTSKYTGTHQHRFGTDGKGRGLAGRDRVMKGSGTADVPYDDGAPIRDLSQITRTNLRSKDAKAQARPKSGKQVQEAKQHRCRETNCVNSCSPISKHGFCSYHMWQESESAKFPKSKGVTQTSPESVNRHHQRSTSSLCQVPECGNDRGQGGFCTVHSKETAIAAAENKPIPISEEQVEMAQAPTSSGDNHCVIQSCDVAIYRMGYCRQHFQEMQEMDDEHADDKKSSAMVSPTTSKASKAASADKALARLTDAKLYTGSHQHRFDKSGNGLGLDGRESVVKGSGTAVKYRGGKVSDISQVLRQ